MHKRERDQRGPVSWLRDRLTKKRLAAVAVLLATSVAVIALGDPLAHPGEGEQADGQRGVAGMPRIVELSAVAIAIILALPPSGRRSEPDDP